MNFDEVGFMCLRPYTLAEILFPMLFVLCLHRSVLSIVADMKFFISMLSQHRFTLMNEFEYERVIRIKNVVKI